MTVGEVDIFVGQNYILSSRDGDSQQGFQNVRARAEKEPHMLRLGPAFVLYALMDTVVDRYFPVLDMLETELEMLNLYLQLEQARLKGSFEYTIAMEDELMTEEIKVPTLILQPFAENAIWHGLLNKPGDNRMLRISGALVQDAIRLTVEDNGIGRKKAAGLRNLKHSYKSVAIDLISKRLNILREQSGFESTGFKIFDIFNHRQEPGGIKVEIILPVIN